uniref:Protein unc-50 n=2 Tax=Ascaris TaxID=6251 RepID=A0A0M3I902_ASCLU
MNEAYSRASVTSTSSSFTPGVPSPPIASGSSTFPFTSPTGRTYRPSANGYSSPGARSTNSLCGVKLKEMNYWDERIASVNRDQLALWSETRSVLTVRIAANSTPLKKRHSFYSSGHSADRVGCLTAVRMSAGAKLNRYMRRLIRFKQMDFEFAIWQMVFLLVQPQKVYRNFMYRKKTKDQWARDDPAFLVLLAAALALSSVLFALVIQLSFTGFIAFFLWVVFIDCIGVGLVIATVLWFIANRYLRRVDDQDVEWAYCFDVHLNAFFPLLVFLHVLMPLTYSHLIGYDAILPRLFGNTIWFAAVVYYIYITFLGYTALPILKNTHIFLYPVTFLFIFYVATVTAGWNISRTAMAFYHFRAENVHRNV